VSPAPRIGRPRNQQIVDLSPAESAARAAVGITLDAPLTNDEIAARTAPPAGAVASCSTASGVSCAP
jgi:hypothetical protein